MKIYNAMKFATQKLIMVAVCLLLGFSCAREKVDFSTTENEKNENIGYLEFSNLNVLVDRNGEIVSKADEAPAYSEASDNYVVTIFSEKTQSVVLTKTYGEIKSGDPIALTPGVYQINIVSTTNETQFGWDSPYYSCTKSVTIVGKKTTQVGDLICRLANIKTSISFSADLGLMFKPDDGSEDDLNVNVSLGDSSLDFGRDEKRCGFFKAVEESNELVILLSGMYNNAAADEEPEYVKIDGWKQVIPNVKAGQWRKINIRVESAHDGTVVFAIDVETWVYDENIDVDVMSQSYVFEEDSIYDPDNEVTDKNSPVVSLANGHDIDEPFVVDESIFDFDAETCLDVIKANVSPVGGSTVESIDVTFSSSNSSFISALESAGFEGGKVSMLPTNEVAEYMNVNNDDDVVVMTAKYAAMKAIFAYAGEHEAKIMVVDSEGRRSFTYFTIKVVAGSQGVEGPAIEWRAGYSFDTRHEITPETTLPVVFDIISESGISGFMITIDSDILTENELAGLKLAKRMDLINPANDDMRDALVGLGFPVGDAVKNATKLEFNITSFMPMLAMLGAGNSDFMLEISDAKGTTVRTLKVKAL